MTKASHIHTSDLLGFSRLAIDATAGLSELVEAMHHNIARAPGILDTPSQGPTSGITGLVYQSIRLATGLVGGGIEAILAPLVPMLEERSSPPERQAVLAALNGVMGDYLAATDNPLAISIRLRHKGKPLTLEREALAGAIPRLNSKLVVLAHGLCMNDLQWKRKGHDHGVALARDLGYTPVLLHYNSGLHVSTNGFAFAMFAFAKLLETLLDDVTSRCSEQINDLLNGLVCLVVRRFEFAIRPVAGIRLVMKPAVGERAAELFVEEQEQERDLHAFGSEPVSVEGTIAFEQTVAFEFAQIVAELVQPVSYSAKLTSRIRCNGVVPFR